MVALVALIALLLYEYKRRAQYLQIEKPVEVIPATALDILLARVKSLEGHRLDEQEDFKAYYTELTGALRSYWGETLQFDTLEKTSSELIEALRQRSLSTEYLRVIEELFREADYVKFAKSLPLRSDTERLTQRIITCTKDHHEAQEQARQIAKARALEGKEVIE